MFLCWWCGMTPLRKTEHDGGQIVVTFTHECPVAERKKKESQTTQLRRARIADRNARMELLLREYRLALEADVIDVDVSEKFLVDISALLDEIDAEEEADAPHG